MSDTPQPLPLLRSAQDETNPVAAPEVPPRAAERLKQARENAGLHVVALAAMLKVPVKKLEALEAGRYDELTDATFVRTLAMSVCRQLKVDPTEILADLPQAPEVKLAVAGRSVALDRPAASSRPVSPAIGSALKPAHWVGLGLLAAATVVWWALPPRAAEPSQAIQPVVAPVTPTAGDPPPLTQPGIADPAGSSSLSASAAVPAPAASTAGSQPATAPAIAPVTTVSPPAAPSGSPAAVVPSAVAPDTAQAVLGIRVRESAWVEVLDATGAVRLQRLLQAGEAVAFQSGGPFSVVAGRADVTDVWVRGQKLELADRARLNVARFEVK